MNNLDNNNSWASQISDAETFSGPSQRKKKKWERVENNKSLIQGILGISILFDPEVERINKNDTLQNNA